MLKIKQLYVARDDCIHLCVVMLVVFSLSEAGPHTLIANAVLSWESSRVELSFTASFCCCDPVTLQCWREESHLRDSSQPLCVSRIHGMPKGEVE